MHFAHQEIIKIAIFIEIEREFIEIPTYEPIVSSDEIFALVRNMHFNV